jgi:hypothetical protein
MIRKERNVSEILERNKRNVLGSRFISWTDP